MTTGLLSTRGASTPFIRSLLVLPNTGREKMGFAHETFGYSVVANPLLKNLEKTLVPSDVFVPPTIVKLHHVSDRERIRERGLSIWNSIKSGIQKNYPADWYVVISVMSGEWVVDESVAKAEQKLYETEGATLKFMSRVLSKERVGMSFRVA